MRIVLDSEYYFKNENLVIWQPKNMLDSYKIKDFITFLDESSKSRDPHFSRFVDLTKISGLSVNYENLMPVAQTRQKYYVSNFTRKVKMGFFVNNPLAFGMARMYQSLNDDKYMETLISESLDEIAKFLKCDKSELEI